MIIQNEDRQFVRQESLKKHIGDNLIIDWSDFVILFCSVIIASIGLEKENVPIIVGSMLISPLMDPLLGIGYGGLLRKKDLFNQGCKLLFLQIGVAICASTAYFCITINPQVNQAIIDRTSLSIGVALVAFFGGVAAIIGSAKKDSGNILPGVSIAAALMPPLATIGFGIATLSWDIFIGSLSLFLLNIFLIILGSAIASIPIMHTQSKEKINKDTSES